MEMKIIQRTKNHWDVCYEPENYYDRRDPRTILQKRGYISMVVEGTGYLLVISFKPGEPWKTTRFDTLEDAKNYVHTVSRFY